VAKGALTGYGLVPLASPILLYDLGALYLLMLLYATVGWELGRRAFEPKTLLIAVLATAATVGWVVVGAYQSIALVYMLVPPAFAIAAISWVIGRKA
jgi:hypothetical protein